MQLLEDIKVVGVDRLAHKPASSYHRGALRRAWRTYADGRIDFAPKICAEPLILCLVAHVRGLLHSDAAVGW